MSSIRPDMKKSELTRMKVDDLRRELRTLGITTEGKKDVLVSALWHHVSGRMAAATATAGPSATAPAAPPAEALPSDVLGHVRRSLTTESLATRLRAALALSDREGVQQIRRMIQPTTLRWKMPSEGPRSQQFPASDAGEMLLREKLAEMWDQWQTIFENTNGFQKATGSAGFSSDILLKNDSVGVLIQMPLQRDGAITVFPYNVPSTSLKIRYSVSATRATAITIHSLKLEYKANYYGFYPQPPATEDDVTEHLDEALIGIQWIRQWLFATPDAKIEVSGLFDTSKTVYNRFDYDFPITKTHERAFFKKAERMLVSFTPTGRKKRM